jgi:lactate dehydrogenase-like 2-hydroxyacid dehydrogenase
VLTDAVADLAVGLLIDTLRGVSRADRFVRDGRWAAGETFPLTREVSGSTGGHPRPRPDRHRHRRTPRRFGCAIAYHSRGAVDGVPYLYAASPVALAEASDVLVVVVPGGPATEKIVDDDVLAALGPDGYLVNVARGSVVDQDRWCGASPRASWPGRASTSSPTSRTCPPSCWQLDSVVLQPHVASATEQTRQVMADLILENLRSFLAGDGLITPVPGSVA